MTRTVPAASAVRGLVLTPQDAGYEDARRPFNAAVDRRPEVIVQVAGPRDVAVVLDAAARTGRTVSVRGAGHHLDGHALAGDVVIDLSALRGVTVDPSARTAVVRGGTTWAELDAAADAHGLAVPGARVSHVGVAGTVLGGGEGWLSIAHGLSSDSLVAADVVTVGGLLHTGESAETELFWALRGGRVDVGVVTAMTLRLHPVPQAVLGGMLLYPLPELPAVLATLAQLHAQGRAEFAGTAHLLTAPPAAFVPGDLVGRPVAAVVPAWLADPREGRSFITPLVTAVRPLVDAVSEVSYCALQAGFDALAPWGLRRASCASVVADVSGPLALDLVETGTALPGSGARISITRMAGTMTRPVDSAFPHREAGWLVNPTTQWRHRRHDGRHGQWLAEVAGTVRAHGELATSLNHETPEPARVRALFGPQRHGRLLAAKAAYDPRGVFA